MSEIGVFEIYSQEKGKDKKELSVTFCHEAYQVKKGEVNLIKLQA
jgi:hypothetical protein